MTRLSGAAAEARLAEAWDEVFSHGPETQQIVHVLTRLTEYPAWVTDFSPFRAWMSNGCKANAETWKVFGEIAASWPYIHNARRAAAAGISIIRILPLERASRESSPPWLRYLAQVHLPGIAALAGEAFYRVWLEDCRDSGLPDRDCDVNLWGAGGVMLAGYQDGDVSWRTFLTDDCGTGRYHQERDFVMSMRDLASTRGELVELPVGLL